MMLILSYLIITLYITAACTLMIYGLNCYVMIFLYKKNSLKEKIKRNHILNTFHGVSPHPPLPIVTTQVPVYNEFNVIERIMRAACRIQYPVDRHEIQILDDSTDETIKRIDDVAEELARKGHDIKIIRRINREGFKAGALDKGLKIARGDYIAIFDADFVPPEDFLLKTIPFFLENSRIGLVQARWGHLNRNGSFLTNAQSIGIDGHFMVEQSARNFGGLYMNFNGTAGVFKKDAIIQSGGWEWDTLTEDMDLSYRIQFNGWEALYNPDMVVPAEIPDNMPAFKSQQFRWAKGSIQTAIKLFPDLMTSKVSAFKKLEAFFHLTHYAVHPLMVMLAILSFPVISMIKNGPGPVLFSILATVLVFAMAAPSALYITSQQAIYPAWVKRTLYLPFLVILGTGIAVSNSKAVAEALLGIKSDFIRTPKKGSDEQKKYEVHVPWTAFFEILLGSYALTTLLAYLRQGTYVIGPFLLIYTAGFLFTGFLTLYHTKGQKKA